MKLPFNSIDQYTPSNYRLMAEVGSSIQKIKIFVTLYFLLLSNHNTCQQG